jgi:hypothetical protein
MRKTINATPNTQPTCGLALKVKTIDPVKINKLRMLILFWWKMTKKAINATTSQNSVGLSRSPKLDHTKWLGKKAKVRINVVIKFSL